MCVAVHLDFRVPTRWRHVLENADDLASIFFVDSSKRRGRINFPLFRSVGGLIKYLTDWLESSKAQTII